jgi:molybdate transport system regulatory protein
MIGTVSTPAPPSPLKIKIQLFCGDEIAMGPGKADLLDAIAREGSISAAGRALGMSYRRTWLLVDVMNRCWDGPLVETAAGGSHGGGARVTPLGREILARYRELQRIAGGCDQSEAWENLKAALRVQPMVHQNHQKTPSAE